MDNSVENGEAEIIEAKEERFSLILQNGAEDSQVTNLQRSMNIDAYCVST